MSLEEPVRFRKNIRFLLAKSCAKHLSADLFILDEFQRFKSLLNTTANNDESLIAKEVFHPDRRTKVLLLSATPFKALSHVDEDEKGDAHSEELKFLLKFISRSDDEKLAEYEKYRHEVQLQILSLRDIAVSTNSLNHANKDELEKILRQYICRTERAQMCDSYENLLDTQDVNCVKEKDFTQQDIKAFNAIDKLGLSLQKVSNSRLGSQLMEFYKATPWPLSFLSGYQFKLQLDAHRTNILVKDSLIKSKPAWLSYANIQEYKIELINAPHAKTRALVSQIFKTPSEELLWVPPSLPHYPLQGSFEDQSTFSKTLLFSSWALVPRALSGLISYEAERRLLLNRKGEKKAYHDVKHSPKIKFDSDASLSGWSLVYPSKTMLDMPLTNGISNLSALILDRTDVFKKHLENMSIFATGSRTGDRWFALAPMLLDKLNGHDSFVKDWFEQELKITDQTGREKHLKSLKAYLDDDNLQLGPMPEDLADYLAQLSIAGPAVCIARAWHCLWPDETEQNIVRVVTQSAFAAVAMFNKPESESVLNKRYKTKAFQSIVRYCADGGFQAVIDEYGHLLKDAGLPMIGSKTDYEYSATKRLINVFEFRTSSVACQFLERKNETSEQVSIKAGKSSQKHTLRCHYAVSLGNQKMADDKGVQRASAVRDVFNSPFRPFMLNSTSIGQEGLDFHWYCHRVVHWNVPSNPIDIEQREGRVNRYKSLVVRKRITQQYKSIVNFDNGDAWENLFKQVDSITKENGRKSDLVPYWHIPEGDAKIERYVPMLPMSKDIEKFEKSLKILTLYRLAFGQPRQEELLDNLLKRKFSSDEIEQIKNALVINLSPIMHMAM